MLTRNIIFSTLLLFLFACASKVETFYPFGDINKPSLNTYPQELYQNFKIAVIPTKVSGNPNKKTDNDITIGIQNTLKHLGFSIIDYNIVNGIINELTNDVNLLTLTDYKKIQKDLNCDALFITDLQYKQLAAEINASENSNLSASGSLGGYAYGSSSGNLTATDTQYRKESISLSLTNYNTFTTYITETSKYGYWDPDNDGKETLLMNGYNQVRKRLNKKFNVKNKNYIPNK